jgi:hypothetical protein
MEASADSGMEPAAASNRSLTETRGYETIWIVACDTWFMVVSTFALAS